MKLEYLDTHLAKHEYIEGPQATENFKRFATAVLQAKKTTGRTAKPKKRASPKPEHGKGEA
jgi:hypothetical protein